ncbi:MAG: hypothetical protein GY870_18940 [archaeon]|nr:hypothetical protein [archaeon]
MQINRAKWRKKEFFYNSMMIDEIKDDIEDIIKQWQYKINIMEKILDQKPPTLKKMKKLKKLNKNIPS